MMMQINSKWIVKKKNGGILHTLLPNNHQFEGTWDQYRLLSIRPNRPFCSIALALNNSKLTVFPVSTTHVSMSPVHIRNSSPGGYHAICRLLIRCDNRLYTDGRAILSKMRFSILLKDTSTCGLSTGRPIGGRPLYQSSHTVWIPESWRPWPFDLWPPNLMRSLSSRERLRQIWRNPLKVFLVFFFFFGLYMAFLTVQLKR